MDCFMCSDANGSLQKLSDLDINIFKQIAFVLPALIRNNLEIKHGTGYELCYSRIAEPDELIPKSKEPVFICSTCVEQISCFYTVRKASLQNCSRLKHFNAVLKRTINLKCNELSVIINRDEGSLQRKHQIKFKISPKSKYLLSSDERDATRIKEEENEDVDYSQQLVNDEGSLNHLQDNESSSNSDDSTQHHAYVGSFEFVDTDKFTEKDSNLTSKNSGRKDQPKTHESENKRIKYTECHKTFTMPSDLEQHSRFHTEVKLYKCTTCQKTFTRYNLNRHTLTHTNEKSHECAVCHKSFKEKSQLIIHKQFHNNVNPYKCGMCSEAFIQSSDLNTHIRTHTGEKSDQCQTQRGSQEKRLKCTECHKTFAYRSKLETHSLVHTREKLYKCTTCQKTFPRLDHLNRHQLTHTGEKPHECDVCHKTFSLKCNLITHKRYHNNVHPYQCAVCSKGFVQSCSLSRHMRSHTGEKPHQCDLCEYKCTQAGDLKKHIRSHTGEKPYSCKYCEKSFTRRNHLKEHERKLHNNEEQKLCTKIETDGAE